MSLEKIYIKLYNTSARGSQRLYNNFGILYTALSRCTDPKINVLIERFPPELLDAIAQSDTMKAMREEFAELKKKCEKTRLWAENLLTKFDELFDESQHVRQTKVVLTQLPAPPEKVINMITKQSKRNSRWASSDASTNDFHDSRGLKRPLPKAIILQSKKKRRTAAKRRRKRVAPPSTRHQRSQAKKQRIKQNMKKLIRRYLTSINRI